MSAGLLSRTLNSAEVVQELARGVHRTIGGDGVFVARPDLDAGTVVVLHRIYDGIDGSVRESDQRSHVLDGGAVEQAARVGEVSASVPPSAVDGAVAGDQSLGAVVVAPLMHGRRLPAWSACGRVPRSVQLGRCRVVARHRGAGGDRPQQRPAVRGVGA
ncbi:MAG: hypothetical protein U0163_19160 [Gemmatimonadaceae bacterium]